MRERKYFLKMKQKFVKKGLRKNPSKKSYLTKNENKLKNEAKNRRNKKRKINLSKNR